MKEKLTSRDIEMLEFIKTYMDKYGYAPSYEEIGESLHLKSKSSVYAHMQKLFEAGELETDHPGMPRAFRIRRERKE